MNTEYVRDSSFLLDPFDGHARDIFKTVTINSDERRQQAVARLIADANWALAHRPEHARMAAAIKRHRDGIGMLDFASRAKTAYSCQKEHQALVDALPPEAAAEPEPLTITVTTDTAGEIVAMLTKVANLLEKGGD